MAGINAWTEPPADPRREQLSRLAEWLRGDKAIPEVDVDPGDAVLTVVRHEGGDITVTCRARHEDGGKLWFYFGVGTPITEADNIADAALRIRERARSPV